MVLLPETADQARRLTIETPEGVRFSLLLAGPVVRMLAWWLDTAVILALSQGLNATLSLTELVAPDLTGALGMVLYFVLSIGYGMTLEWRWRGQTIGKRVLGLRVMDVQGFRLRFPQVVIRNLLRAVDALPLLYFLGGAVCLASPRRQRLGDLAAGTTVIRHEPVTPPDLSQLLSGKYNSLRTHSLAASRLRQRVSPREAHVAVSALLRRNDFTPEARVDLFRDLAAHFRSLATFPEEVTEGLSDEQYIRGVMELLHRD